MGPAAAPSGQLAVTLVVLAAAVLHAVWNALAKAVPDRVALFAVMAVAYVACGAAALAVVDPPAPASRPWVAASAAIHALYVLGLIQSYRLGDFNQVYPLARGAGPLLVAAVAATLLDEVPAPAQVAGILGVSGGVVLLSVGGTNGNGTNGNGNGNDVADGEGGARRLGLVHRPALLAALGTGVAIAAYTVIDGVGVRRSGSVAGYAAWLFLLDGLLTVAAAAAIRRRRFLGGLRRGWLAGALAGALSIAAYGLVLWAQTRGALAAVAALRESSVVVAAGIGVVAFDEPLGRRRLLASIVITAGVVLLNTG